MIQLYLYDSVSYHLIFNEISLLCFCDHLIAYTLLMTYGCSVYINNSKVGRNIYSHWTYIYVCELKNVIYGDIVK